MNTLPKFPITAFEFGTPATDTPGHHKWRLEVGDDQSRPSATITEHSPEASLEAVAPSTHVLSAHALYLEEAALREPPTPFSNQGVQAALNWKHGRLAAYVFVESVWPLLDEYRAHLASVLGQEAKR